jgi:S1-C subfamily serine protease
MKLRLFILLAGLASAFVMPQSSLADEKTATKYKAWCVKADKSQPYFGLRVFCEGNGGKVFDTLTEAWRFRNGVDFESVSPDPDSFHQVYWCAGIIDKTVFSTSNQSCGVNFKKFYSEKSAREYVAGISDPIDNPPKSVPSAESEPRLISTGSGFVVENQHVVTAAHVLRKNKRGDACRLISVMYRSDEVSAKIVSSDPANDLGLLKLSKPINATAKLRNNPDLRLGETAVNYGFPLTGTLSSSAKVTSGAVNSLAGINNNSAFLQYDAATQNGNSGGPVMDASGNVIGIVRSGLDNAETQLVNFAVKSTILEGFLSSNKVPFEKADLTEELKLPEIAEKAEAFTVLVGCWE